MCYNLLEPLNRAKDRIGVSLDIHSLIVEFLTYKVYDEKKAKKNNSYEPLANSTKQPSQYLLSSIF